MKRAVEWVRKNREFAAVVFVNVMFLSFFLYFTCNTGIFKDDYGYMYMFSREQKLTGERVDSVADVLSSQYEHYFIMNGRAVSHTMLQMILMMGRGWFSVFNTLFYFLLSFGMYQLVRKSDKHRPLLMLMMYLAPWVLFAEFGKVFLVSYLSVNYLWTMAMIICVLLPFKRLFDGTDIFAQHPIAGASLMFFAGVIAGWLSENGSAAALFAVGCMGLYYLIARKKIPVWCITGFSGMCVGFLAMLLAPGYSVRSTEYESYSYAFQFMKISVYHVLPYYGYIFATLVLLVCLLLIRTEKNVAAGIKQCVLAAAAAVALTLLRLLLPESIRSEYSLLVLACAVGVCAWAAFRCRRAGGRTDDLAAPAALMLTGFAATYAMIASPTFETRSELQFLIFFSCGAAFVTYQFIYEVSYLLKLQLIRPALLAVAVIYAAVSLISTVPAVNSAYEQFKERESYIEEQKLQGNFDITLRAYDIPDNSRVGMHNMINNDPDYWINQATCWYYGIESVKYEQASE